MSYETLFKFEHALSVYTGAPYVVLTDCCTHAIELCLRMDCVTSCEFTAFTYLSIPQLMRQLGVHYTLRTEYWKYDNEYRFHGTNIWDSARLLKPGMYRPGMKQCLSFGNGKPLQLGRVGAILLDNEDEYKWLSRARSDGRDLKLSPWSEQKSFGQGFHYCPSLESCQSGIDKLPLVVQESKYHDYPDLRTIDFLE